MNKLYVIIKMGLSKDYATIVNGTIYFNEQTAKNDCRVYNHQYQKEMSRKESPYHVFELESIKPLE